jgi:hypothetical protein
MFLSAYTARDAKIEPRALACRASLCSIKKILERGMRVAPTSIIEGARERAFDVSRAYSVAESR